MLLLLFLFVFYPKEITVKVHTEAWTFHFPEYEKFEDDL